MDLPNADRVSELYRGQYGSRGGQARARRRVDWLVARARGRVLDVGCSQGVTSLLCARLGLEVLGIDNEEDRIAYAQADRERKPAEVRKRVEFRVADATDLDLPDASFDTVLLGEILEHLAEPERLLAEVSRVAKPDGVVAITVPFGFSPHQDHRHTFLVASFVELVAPYLTIESLAIEEGYLRAHARAGAMDATHAAELILRSQRQLEATVIESQRQLLALRRRRANLIRRARRFRRALAGRELVNRKLRWRLATARRSRSSRALRALAEVRRHPRKVIALPRELFRARRILPPLPKPAPKPRARRVRSRKTLRTAEALEGQHQRLAVELPAAAPLPAGPIARPGLRVATILDRFSAWGFRYEWDQLEVGPEDWRPRLEAEPPDLLFVESAWKGNEDRWARALAGHGPRARELADMVGWCREAGIPTAFWNKEDPPHFETFIHAARLFDHVFTTDSNRVPRYQEALGHERVSVLAFGAQPRVHNPVAVAGGRRYGVAFGGTYLRHKHPARRAQMEAILGPALDRGLHIFSRVQPGESPDLEWPDEFLPYIVGSLPYERMVTAYKAYRLFLNVNSVVDSPTMCARRAFEISATSTPVLSGDSVALRAVFGDLISVANAADEARVHLESLLGEPELAARRGHEAMRHVLAEHTYGHRVDQVLREVGLDQHAGDSAPAISVALPVAREEDLPGALAQTAAQSMRALELVLVPGWPDAEPEALVAEARRAGIDRPTALRYEGETTRGAALRRAAEAARGEYLALLDPECRYGEHYLADLATAFSYTDARVVGKGEAEHAFSPDLVPGSLLCETSLARESLDPAAPDPDRTLVRHCADRGGRTYAADRYSFTPSPAPVRAA